MTVKSASSRPIPAYALANIHPETVRSDSSNHDLIRPMMPALAERAENLLWVEGHAIAPLTYNWETMDKVIYVKIRIKNITFIMVNLIRKFLFANSLFYGIMTHLLNKSYA